MSFGWCVTPHGFGHAARACAVMNACSRRCPSIRHEIFTTVPRGFFAESLGRNRFGYHHIACDVGMVQSTALDEDVPATVGALDRLRRRTRLETLAELVRAAGCAVVVSDIAPMGLAAARRFSIPGVLIESFSWDWIYRDYDDDRLQIHGQRLAEWSRSAGLVIQTEPCCRRRDRWRCVAPISRRTTASRSDTRRRLGIPADARVVLLSTGVADAAQGRARDIDLPRGATAVVPASVRGQWDRIEGDVVVVDDVYHPDLVAASDVVVAKLGYSTVAEVYHGSAALAYLRRPRFRESAVLEAFVRKHVPSAALPEGGLGEPAAARVLRDLLVSPRPAGPRLNGDDDAAELILRFIGLPATRGAHHGTQATCGTRRFPP